MKDDNALITVIVPIYNAEMFLRRCLDSICKQTYTNLEIILVDDGSTDSSGTICDEYAEKDCRIKVLHEYNAGVSTARNKGLKEATGDYLGFVDSDDYIDTDMFRILKENMDKYNSDISVCGVNFVDGNDEKNNNIKKYISVHTSKEGIKHCLKGDMYSGHLCNKIFKRNLFKDLEFDKQIKIYEDFVVVIKTLLKANKIVFDSVPLYNYMIHNESAYNRIFTESHKTAFIALNIIREKLQDIYPNLIKYVDAIEIRYTLSLLIKIMKTGRNLYLKEQKELTKRIRSLFNFQVFMSITNFRNKILIALCLINRNLIYFFIKIKQIVKK